MNEWMNEWIWLGYVPFFQVSFGGSSGKGLWHSNSYLMPYPLNRSWGPRFYQGWSHHVRVIMGTISHIARSPSVGKTAETQLLTSLQGRTARRRHQPCLTQWVDSLYSMSGIKFTELLRLLFFTQGCCFSLWLSSPPAQKLFLRSHLVLKIGSCC